MQAADDSSGSFQSAVDFLSQARRYGVKLGLDTMRSLVAALGHPEKPLRFLHIAGTNGKGSAAAFCATALQQAGHRVGLFTSPHLRSVRERVQIDGTPISREAFAAAMSRIITASRAESSTPTFFEIMTALALLHFTECDVDWVVWETGLGGRLDSTNIVTPVASLITSIGLDHGKQLGSTLAEITTEKAGIIKPGVPVITAVTQPEALAILQKVARQNQARLTVAGQDFPLQISPKTTTQNSVQIDHHPFTLGLLGPHQARNAACAYAALTLPQIDLALEKIQAGFTATRWPGRCQILRENPPFVLDGAHNTEAAAALRETWGQAFGSQTYHLVFGTVTDKPYAEMAELLRPAAHRVTLVRVPSERALDPAQLAPHFAGLPVRLVPDLAELWPELYAETRPVLITGSLFLIGQALRLAQPENTSDDFTLNELFA